MALSAGLQGVVMLAMPDLFTSERYNSVRPYLDALGATFMAGGLGLLWTQAAPRVSRFAVWAAWFTVRLAAGKTAMSDAAPAAAPAGGFGGLRVLLADDASINRRVAARMLERLGCTVESVADGRAAVAAVASTAFDMVLMDCFMPEMDDYTATEEIRRWEQRGPECRAPVPIIALTASVAEEDRQRCLAAGMNDFLPKPCRSEDLTRMLARWVAGPAA
jgi:CheY-like chemotaxis protein